MTIQPQFCVDCGIQLNFRKKAERCCRCRIIKNQLDKGVGWTQPETDALKEYMEVEKQVKSLYSQIKTLYSEIETGQTALKQIRKKFSNHSGEAINRKKTTLRREAKLLVC